VATEHLSNMTSQQRLRRRLARWLPAVSVACFLIAMLTAPILSFGFASLHATAATAATAAPEVTADFAPDLAPVSAPTFISITPVSIKYAADDLAAKVQAASDADLAQKQTLIPSPAAIVLGGLGMAAMFRRKRTTDAPIA